MIVDKYDLCSIIPINLIPFLLLKMIFVLEILSGYVLC